MECITIESTQASNISNFKKSARDFLVLRYDYKPFIFYIILVLTMLIYSFSYLTFLYHIYIFLGGLPL